MNMQGVTVENNLSSNYIPLNQMGNRNQPSTTPLTPTKNLSNPDIIDNIGKHCENPDCTAPTLISLVQQDQSPQLIQEPTVIEDPLLISGYTTVFQITGKQVNNKNNTNNNDKDKPIYKIIPNTHAHIVNFVVVDADGEMFRKIKENDPITLKKLMDAQKSSADQLLDKLICTDKTALSQTNNNILTKKNQSGLLKLPQKQLRQLGTISITSNQQQNISTSPIVGCSGNITQPSNNVSGVNSKLPFNVPSNLTIRTITPPSAQRGRGRPKLYPTKLTANETTQKPTTNPVQIIGHPNLKITSVQSIGATNSNSSSPAPTSLEKSDLEKMREEIDELRETVKRITSNIGNDAKKQKT